MRKHDVLFDRQVREQIELLEHHTQMRTHLVEVDTLGAHVHALNDNRATRGMLQTIDAAKHRRLARARGAQDYNDLTLVNIQIDIAQDHVVAKGLLEVLDADDDLVGVLVSLMIGPPYRPAM